MIEINNNNNNNNNSAIEIVDEYSLPSRLSITQKCLLLLLFIFLLLIIIGLTAVIWMIIIRSDRLRKDFKMKEKIISEKQDEINRITYQLNNLRLINNQSKQLLEEQQLRDNQTIQQLNNRYVQLL